MRQFILASAVAYSAAATVQAMAAGSVGVFYQKAGVPTVTATGLEVTGKADLAVGRSSANGGPIIIPIHKNDFSYVRGDYQVATKFSATITVPAPSTIGEYTLIVALKGAKFHERNRFTSGYYAKTATMTATQLAAALVADINSKTISSGVSATNAAAVITITSVSSGVDYAVIPTDLLTGLAVTVVAPGIPAYGDATYVRDLANKAAADKGFNYTYSDDMQLLYPGFDADPLAQPSATDIGYTIFTIRCAEPRDVKTRDEVVHQIVQVAFPTGAAAIATFETVLKALSGIVPPAP